MPPHFRIICSASSNCYSSGCTANTSLRAWTASSSPVRLLASRVLAGNQVLPPRYLHTKNLPYWIWNWRVFKFLFLSRPSERPRSSACARNLKIFTTGARAQWGTTDQEPPPRRTSAGTPWGPPPPCRTPWRPPSCGTPTPCSSEPANNLPTNQPTCDMWYQSASWYWNTSSCLRYL